MDEPVYRTKKDRLPKEREYTTGRKELADKLGRTQKAMQMKVDGIDYPEIAVTLGYSSPAEAANDVRQALEEEFLSNEQWAPEIIRMIELKRLNTLYQALLPGVQRGNSRSADVAVKVSDRIAKLTGVDAALKTQIEVVEIGHVNAEIEKLKREIAERQTTRGELAAPVYDVEVVRDDPS